MSKRIVISDEIYEIIQQDAIPLEDTPDSVLRKWARRLGKMDESNSPENSTSGLEKIGNNNRVRRPYTRSQPPEDAVKITQRKIIPFLLVALRKFGGGAEKNKVEQEIYNLLKDTFDHPFYHELVSWGTPRWKHYISWAKQIAVNKELVKSASQSGRGCWELTKKGKSPSAFKE